MPRMHSWLFWRFCCSPDGQLNWVSLPTQETVSNLVAQMGNVTDALLPLLCLGEIGRRADLGDVSGLLGVIQAAFDSTAEDVKNAASFALGSVAIGTLGVARNKGRTGFLPYILEQIDAQPRLRYSLMHALKEVRHLLLALELACAFGNSYVAMPLQVLMPPSPLEPERPTLDQSDVEASMKLLLAHMEAEESSDKKGGLEIEGLLLP